VALDATGKFLYVANLNSSTISAYTVNSTTGGLTALAGSPFAAIVNPWALTADASGKHLYVAGSGGVAGYTIDSTSGALTAMSGSPFTTDCCFNDDSLAADPTGRFLYAANYSSGTVYGYSIDQVSGGLTAMTGSPFTAGSNGQHLAVDASGRFVYVTLNNNPGTVVALAIDGTSGALTTVSGSPFAAGPSPYAVTTTGAAAVSTATLVSLQLSPNPLTITTSHLGGTAQLLLLGTYSDGTVRSLTESAGWSSSNTLVASISSTAGTNGLVTTAGYGTTTITASYNSQTVSETLTVQAPPLVSITVTPASPAIASGTAIQLHATATYSDNSTQEVTTQVTWSSSNTAVATVSNTSGTQGLATGISSGTVTITATENGVSGTATLTAQ
jgi:DNA-binding beta-propeller fold protein YncE